MDTTLLAHAGVVAASLYGPFLVPTPTPSGFAACQAPFSLHRFAGHAIYKNTQLPALYPWALGVGLIGLTSLAHALYQYGGRFIVLFPALYWLIAVQQTTGALALAIGVYSRVANGEISAQWFALPTGCTPLAMASQYVPSHYLQAFLVGVAAAVAAMNNGTPFLLPLALVAASGFIGDFVDFVGFEEQILLGAALVTFGLILSGAGGKIKLK